MSNEWVQIYSFSDPIRARLAGVSLEEYEIPHQLVNRQDTAYVMLGEIHLMVPKNMAVRAKRIVDDLVEAEEED